MSAYNAFGSHPPLPERAGRASGAHAGKVFLVTGAAGGIGRGLVSVLAAEGASIVAADLHAGDFPEAAEDALLVLAVDLADPASAENAVARAVAWRGRLDGLVNAAAVALHEPPLDTARETWRRQFEINLFGAYDTARFAAKAMIAAGTRGAIVNVASEAGKVGHPETMIAYSATKAALISMTRMLSAALAPHDINVNCVCPGSVATPMLRGVADVYSQMTGESPDAIFRQMVSSQMQRHTTPAEVARAVSFLLGDDAMPIRGQAINIDGGDTPY